ncbi:MAG: hypothetical protein LBF42_03755, partial [Puniceicoccales bacterium]|nr:hypothetical protein [Puniceicoccales bacterium]
IFAFVAPLVQAHIIGLLDLAATYGRDAWLYPPLPQALPKSVSVVPFVCQRVIGNSPLESLVAVHRRSRYHDTPSCQNRALFSAVSSNRTGYPEALQGACSLLPNSPLARPMCRGEALI